MHPSGPQGKSNQLDVCDPLNLRTPGGSAVARGVVYVCPVGRSFIVRADGTIALAEVATCSDALHIADRFFVLVAANQAYRTMAIVLSGAGWDGTEGVCAVRAQQGVVLVQDEASAFVWGMPKAALETGCVDLVLSPQEIGPLLLHLVRDGNPLAILRGSVAALSSCTPASVPPALHDALRTLLATALTKHHTDLGNIQLADRETGTLAIVGQRGFGLDFLSGAALLGMLSTHFHRPRRLTREELRWLGRHSRHAADTVERLAATPS